MINLSSAQIVHVKSNSRSSKSLSQHGFQNRVSNSRPHESLTTCAKLMLKLEKINW